LISLTVDIFDNFNPDYTPKQNGPIFPDSTYSPEYLQSDIYPLKTIHKIIKRLKNTKN